jgi:hypothetical protein
MTSSELIQALRLGDAIVDWVPLPGTALEITADAVRVRGLRVAVSAVTARRLVPKPLPVGHGRDRPTLPRDEANFGVIPGEAASGRTSWRPLRYTPSATHAEVQDP